ncbi:hypothetical protein NG799_16605 [Laspinema sp. D1]|uniref:Uncharacterized protein n=2 Tax=Laspinema TaxID=2584823 RepID=A0ABT2MT65_9CYAN|nr:MULTISPECIES: hypothetical protein [unclassified Laspinema]MCT7962497.1 hypothetical protein [Laspinema sp. D2b]MCT7967934.1 hypothetical protein [Laspinema sp. D2a]MCT7974196.1 hypothetical protein [Laspinema sp. D3d]MCT7979895.1 hypothetical protein [Laspinema sp. D3b]MCT7990229.1 hypothetical protein [Laspinema sp. D3a]
MGRPTPIKPLFTIHQMIERILESNEITTQEHLQIANVLLSGKNITDEDRRQINRIFELIQSDRIKIIT